MATLNSTFENTPQNKSLLMGLSDRVKNAQRSKVLQETVLQTVAETVGDGSIS